MIELYIENKKIDLAEDIEISFTYETVDPERLSTVKNSFSKTINVPGTPANNITFGHIFRSDKYINADNPGNIDTYYDPHKKVNWLINRNGVLVNRGYCTLDNIVIKNEKDITYHITLYGGIGEFFYSLSYNEDGSPKTLADLFWNWYPKTSINGNGPATDQATESNTVLFKLSSSIVASCWHGLDPLYTYEGTTKIDKDVTLVPCYAGIYEDFDSKHMLVNTFNQRYLSSVPFITNATRSLLRNSFPDTYIDYSDSSQGTEYTTLGGTLSSIDANKYGVVTFSRDVDPWEAGDLRTNELPIAVRLSKLMTVISDPYNNGGYNVVWDDDIRQSYHWLYGWVMMGKLKKEREFFNVFKLFPNSQYDGQNSVLDVSWNGGGLKPPITQDVSSYFLDSNMYEIGAVDAGEYEMHINVLPKLIVNSGGDFNEWKYGKKFVSGTWNSGGIGRFYRFLWTTSVLVHKIYDGNTLIKTIADVFYYTDDPYNLYFGLNDQGIPVDDIKQVLNGRINQRFMSQGEFIDEYRYHDCKVSGIEVEVQARNSTASIACKSQMISTALNLASNVTDLRVEQLQGLMWTSIFKERPIQAGRYGADYVEFMYNEVESPASSAAPIGLTTERSDYNVWWTSKWYWPQQSYLQTTSFGFNMDEGRQNGLLYSKITGFNIIDLDKNTLFASAESPMRYISGYCKMMNYRFLCDETSKTVYIKTLKNYYNGNVKSLDGRVDIGRDICIKNIVTKYKTVNIGTKSAETYPTALFNRISKEKFNLKRYDTGIRYNAGETSLLDDLVYENVMDWQQNSVYYNINPQFPRAYNVQSISWCLFNKDSTNIDNIKKKEIFTVGISSGNNSFLSVYDFLPKVSVFDKDNKYVDFGASMLFLNGFAKNYDYTKVKDNYVISPRVCLSDDTNIQYYLNQSRCYIYDFKYNDNFTYWGCYGNEKSYAASWVLPVFSRDLYNIYVPDVDAWNAAAYKLASWNIVSQENLDDMYTLDGTKFVYKPGYAYQKAADSSSYLQNEYSIEAIPPEDTDTERIYDKNWKGYVDDMYDRNTREVTAYVNLTGFGDVNTILRGIYSWDSHLWIITKLENYKLSNVNGDRFTKVKMHKIVNKSAWTNTNA